MERFVYVEGLKPFLAARAIEGLYPDGGAPDLDVAQPAEPANPPPEPPISAPKRRGRPRKRIGEERGQLLKAIAEIVSQHRKYTSDRSIAEKLKDLPGYEHLEERQRRRIVKEAIDGVIGLNFPLKTLDTKMRERLRGKVFELLRLRLRYCELERRYHEFMSNKAN
jgi:hypothetical protein